MKRANGATSPDAQPLTLHALRHTVISAGASTFRRVLQDIGIPDHPKRVRQGGSLETIKRSFPFQCFHELEQ